MSSLRFVFTLACEASSNGLTSRPQYHAGPFLDSHSFFDSDLDFDHLSGHDNSGLLLHDVTSFLLSHVRHARDPARHVQTADVDVYSTWQKRADGVNLHLEFFDDRHRLGGRAERIASSQIALE
jgi:hypothetical protein